MIVCQFLTIPPPWTKLKDKWNYSITNMASLQTETEEKVAIDSNWKGSKRIIINAVKSKKKLQQRIEDLQNDLLELQKIMANQFVTVLQIHERTPGEAHL